MTKSMDENGKLQHIGSYLKKPQASNQQRHLRTNIEFSRRLSFDYGDKASGKNGGGIKHDTPSARDPAAQRLSILSHQSTKIEKRWNVFRSIPRDQEAFAPRWTLLSAQILKLIAYAVLNLIVLGSGVAAKASLLLMVASIQSADRTFVPCRPLGHKKALIPQDREDLPPNSVAWFYWYLWIAMCVPQVLLFVRSVRVCSFKFVPSPSIHLFFVAFFLESAQTVGISLLVFAVLPGLDSVRASMLLASLAVVPALLRCCRHFERETLTKPKRIMEFCMDFLVLFCQSSSFWVWPSFTSDSFHKSEAGSRILLPIAVLLGSLSFWENFVDRTSAGPKILHKLARLRDRLQRIRYKNQIALTFWKCILSLFFMLICGGARHSIKAVFDLNSPFGAVINSTSTSTSTTAIVAMTKFQEAMVQQQKFANDIWFLFLTLVFSTFLCYQCSRFACKVRMDRFSYAIPIVLVSPITTLMVLSLCEARRFESCYFAHWIPERLFWRCDIGESIGDGLFMRRAGWVWIFWLLSYVYIIRHVFGDFTGRLNKTDTIFMNPLYDGLLVDQSLTLNRRRHRGKRIRSQDLEDDLTDDNGNTEGTETSIACSMTSMSLLNSHADAVTKIYICATMWHETRDEMVQTLKSIIRMDEDQSARKNAQKYLKVVDKDYYELEAHIFFDDSWTDDPVTNSRVPNEFVETFVNAVDEAASYVHKVHMKLHPPVKLDVPYGGRLVWTLPGDNRLFVHLKDKEKIRNKKRWSQVMYMYYLLGHRVMEMINDVGRKQLLADNTFLLTIDGDSKFVPSAVQKLVDLMRKHSRLGSACGRIHPIGSGIMVWYQKFEYAIAHWFQKAAEHVFGCVLCSPGCFSMFRGSALMDDNVMNKYTKLAEEARHFVQYDQGEDRWLSTLLLKQGYRIEYAASADAETHAPEGFNEFFNQRRRWTPSSTANTLDLLYDFQRAVRNNDSLSKFYIFYQMLVILFSLLSPAIIFTMMVFAQTATLPLSHSFILWSNVIPVVSYTIICFVASSNAQLMYAKLLSIMYAFVMMAVLVGTGIQITTEGAGSPISIFVMSLASVFFIAAFFHPHEFANIFYGTVFFLMIPCTYVLLSLYALVNLNVINWGTREAAERATGKTGVETETKWEQFLRRLRGGKKPGGSPDVENRKSYPDDSKAECGCPDLCMCFLCPDRIADRRHRRPRGDDDDDRYVWKGDHLERFDRRLDRIETRLDDATRRPRSLIMPSALVLSTPAGLDGSAEPGSAMGAQFRTENELVDNRTVDRRSPLVDRAGPSSNGQSPGKVSQASASVQKNRPSSPSPGIRSNYSYRSAISAQVESVDSDESDTSEASIQTHGSSKLRRSASLPEITVTSPTPSAKNRPDRSAARRRILSDRPDPRDAHSLFPIPRAMSSIDARKYRQRSLRRYRGRTLIGGSMDGGGISSDLDDEDVEMESTSVESLTNVRGNRPAVIDVNTDRDGERNDPASPDSPDNSTPSWMSLPYLLRGSNDILDEVENQFWVDLIDTYLKPIEKNPTDETRIAIGLRGLRNKVAFGLLLINSLLILIIYLLQMHKELLSLEWNPTGNQTIIKYDPSTGSYRKFDGPLKIEPIGFVIIMFLSLILAIQTIGMVAHRWATLQHTLASTVLPCFKKTRQREYNGEELLEENAVEIAKRLQRLGGEDSSDKRRGKSTTGILGGGGGGGAAAQAIHRRRRVVFNLERARKAKPKPRGLHATFQKRFFNFHPDRHRDSLRGIRLERDNVLFQSDSAKKATARALKKRRDSVIEANIHRSGSFVREDDVADCLDGGTHSQRRPQQQQGEPNLQPTRLDFRDGGSPELRKPLPRNSHRQNSDGGGSRRSVTFFDDPIEI